ncbi:MAG: hypothetical protein L6Q68_03260 [Aquabacterium sp.]|nr:hypothetical protein [Aquabacterium sp.]
MSKSTTIPDPLADVAVIDAKACAAAAGFSVSRWLALVRERAAPQPAVREPRCTRWKLADVRAWLIARAERGAAQQPTPSAAGALKASARAAEARRQRRAELHSVRA